MRIGNICLFSLKSIQKSKAMNADQKVINNSKHLIH